MSDHIFARTEFKFAGAESDPGSFDGYASVFNVVDSHSDAVMPGAFTKTLAEHKAAGTMPGLYIEHGQYSPFGPPLLPVGVWQSMAEDAHGLHVRGKISALDTDHGRQVRSLMQDGAIRGLSIAYSVPPGGATTVRDPKPGEPRRFLREVKLDAVDLVRSPSNPHSIVTAVKRVAASFDSKADLEDWLHAAGLSCSVAKKVARGGWQALATDDVDPVDTKAVLEALRLQRDEIATLKVR